MTDMVEQAYLCGKNSNPGPGFPLPAEALPEVTAASPGAMSTRAYVAADALSIPLVTAPAAAPVAVSSGAGALTGDYFYSVVFVTASGATEPGPQTAPLTLVANAVTLSSIPVSANPLVVSRKIYRSKGTEPGNVYTGTGRDLAAVYLVATISDNVTTTLADNVADAAVGAVPSYRNTTGSTANTSMEMGGNVTLFGIGAGGAGLGSDRLTAIGYLAGGASYMSFGCTFVGSEAGYSNGAIGGGDDNTFVGNRTGRLNTSGLDNAFFGQSAGEFNSTGSTNTFIGEESGTNTAGNPGTGSELVFVGESAGAQNGSGDRNTYVGMQAGARTSPTACFDNVCVGRTAGRSLASVENTIVGSQAGYATTNGGKNTFLGFGTGYGNTTGNKNTWIGHPDAVDSATNRVNTSTLGFGAKPTKDNQVVLGNADVVETLLRGRVLGGTLCMSSIPIYANNAAALAGNLVAGDFYRTNANPDPVCIVH